MRLKVLLGILMSLLVLSTIAAAAGSQLTDVSVATQGATTTLVLQANGPYTHTEYRPTDTIYLVDLTGVSAGKLEGLSKSVQSTGVAAYHVATYTGTGGAAVTRVEITLAPGAKATVSEEHGQLAVHVANATATATHATTPVVSAPVVAGRTVKVERVSVVRGKDGLQVDILANGPLAPKAMLLTGPDRLVVDLPNAIPGTRSRDIAVNNDQLKTVRMARFEAKPPVTRVVLDLTAATQYDLVPSGNKLSVKLHSATAAAPVRAPKTTEVATVTPPAPAPVTTATTETKPAPTTAVPFAVLNPKFETKTDTTATNDTTSTSEPQIAHSSLTNQETDAVPLVAGNAEILNNGSKVDAAFQQQMNTQTIPTGPQSCSRTRYTGDPISVNLKDVDLKDFFRLIHDISRLNIVLDPNVKGSLTIVLDNVPWDQALNIVLRNNGLDCEIDGNVLRIATLDTLKKEADAQRAQTEARALAVPRVTVTRYLNYAHAKDVVPTIKKFLSARGDIISDDRMNALIISDIPSYLPNVDRLIKELDRKTSEVEIESRVVAATRSFARDLGMQMGFGWGNASSTVGGNSTANNFSPASGPVPGGFTSASGSPTINTGSLQGGGTIPLFSNFPAIGATSGLSFLNVGGAYRLDAYLTMAESRGLLKVLARPRVVTQNNIPALVQQGVRVPVVTQAQLGGPPTVTYVDAFLRLTVTPQITSERTIFLNVDVENTTPDFGHQVQGNPTLLTAQAKTQVLVTDGGTVVIGGVIQTQNSVTMQQTPVLGNIPIFGNLFKRRAVSTQTQELIFFITPKMIQT